MIDNSPPPSFFISLSISFPRLLISARYFVYICIVPIFSHVSILFMYLLSLFFFFATRMLYEWISLYFFPYFYPKCKLVTIRYWTMFNNTIIHTRDAGRLFPSCFSSSSLRDVQRAHPILLRFPAITMMTTILFSLSYLLSFSLFLYIPVSPSLSFLLLYSCSDCALPPRRLLSTLPCTIRFFLPFSYPVLITQTLDTVINWTKCIS